MALKSSLLALALEDATTSVDVEVETTLPVHEELQDITEAAAEVDENLTAQDTVEEVAEALEGLAVLARGTLATGGMDAGQAQFLGYSVESHAKRIPGLRNTVPSQEAFGQTGSKLAATNLALESIGQMLKDLWATLKNLIMKAIRSVKDYYNKVFSGAARMAEKAKAIREKANKITNVAKEKSFDSGTLGKSLHISGKAPADIAAEIGKLEALAAEVYTKHDKTAIAAIEAYIEGVDAVDMTSDATFGTSAAGVISKLKDKFSTATTYGATSDVPATDARFKDLDRTEFDVKHSDQLLGGKAIFSTRMKSAPTDAKEFFSRYVGTMKVDLNDFSANEVDVTNLTFETLPTRTVAAACTKIEDLARKVVAFQKTNTDLEKLQDRLVASGDKFQKNSEKAKELSEGVQAVASSILRGHKEMLQMSQEPFRKFSGYVMSTAGAVLAYCEKSLAQY